MMGNANAAMPPTQEFQGSSHGVKLPAASLAAEYHGQAEQPPIHDHDPFRCKQLHSLLISEYLLILGTWHGYTFFCDEGFVLGLGLGRWPGTRVQTLEFRLTDFLHESKENSQTKHFS
jgi:hypothetical protein